MRRQYRSSSGTNSVKDFRYRKGLEEHIGRKITLECSEFFPGKVADDKTLHMLLKNPIIKKLGSRTFKKDWVLGHLWIKVPPEMVNRIRKYSKLARRLRIIGYVKPYRYVTGESQVGIVAVSVMILKFRRDLAKKYKLSPGQQLSSSVMDEILKKENIDIHEEPPVDRNQRMAAEKEIAKEMTSTSKEAPAEIDVEPEIIHIPEYVTDDELVALLDKVFGHNEQRKGM